MNLDGTFFSVKKREYNENTLECIKEAVMKLEEIDDKPLMMLGKIQSGKTKSFIGVISLAFDNGYDLAVVLTKNSNALAIQTTARMEQEFKCFKEDDLLNIFDIMCIPNNLSRFELNQKMILVVKKQHKNLPKLMSFIKQYALDRTKRCLIIDDEADFCSIGYQKDKETENFDLRTIASQINDLRLKLTCRFIQVTATPYSLYLQPEEVELGNNKEITPVKPAYTVLVPSGDGYIGGEYYFNRESNSLAEHLFYPIDQNELDIIKSSDRRKFKEEDSLKSPKIAGIRTAIMNFIVGGCVRVIQNGGQPTGKKNKFSLILHTEIQNSAHTRQENIINELMNQLEKEVSGNTTYFKQLIEESYNDIKVSVEDYGFVMPSIEEVTSKVREAVKDQWITKIIVNHKNDIDTLLDQDGQLKLRTPLNIFVGGQILDRGITIANLIGFYYGRRPNKMQQDTVLQHSRMFGYRDKKDLAVTRFYSTNDIYSRMVKINEFDAKLREDFESGKLDNGVIFISKDKEGKVIPCAPSKILLSNTHVLKPGKTTLPVGFKTGFKTNIKKYNEKIDKIIMENNKGNLRGVFTISKEQAINIVETIYKTIELENMNTVDCDTFVSLIKYLSNSKVHVVSRIDREISKHRESRYYSDMPYNRAGDFKPAKEAAINEPALILLKQKGKVEHGWSGAEFWWPVLVSPQNTQTAVFSSDLVV